MNKFVFVVLIVLLLATMTHLATSSSTTTYPYNLTIVKAPDAWDFATGKNVLVAVIDSGLDLTNPNIFQHIFTNTHEQANDRIDNDHNGYVDDIHGWDFRSNDNNVDGADIYPHGTEMAGIVLQNAPNATILPIRFLDSAGTFNLADTFTMLPNAIEYAISMNACVILMSFGYQNAFSPNSVAAFQRAYNHNITLVSSSGNDGQNNVLYPAAYNTTIAVGSIDANKFLSNFSNYGSQLDFVAPGTSIYTSDIGGSLVRVDGTSASAASVAALCTLLYEIRSSITPREIYSILKNTAEDVYTSGYDTHSGYGLVNFALAVRSANDVTPPSLILNTYNFTKVNDFSGTFTFFFRIQEDSYLSLVDFYFKDQSDSTWSTLNLCSKVYFNSTYSNIDLSFDLTTSDIIFSYYLTAIDIAGHVLQVGSSDNPIVYPTGLINSTSNLSSSSITTIINTSYFYQSGSDNTSSIQNTGVWYSKSQPHTTPFNLQFFCFTIILVYIRRKSIHESTSTNQRSFPREK